MVMSTNALIVLGQSGPGALPLGAARRMTGWAASLVARVVIAGLEYRLRRKTSSVLSALSDRTLSDIGLHPSEIHSATYERVIEQTRARFAMY
jgi:uncharacterized protein YjiS (DUF1127 family)